MPFAHDTEMSLLATVALVNTLPLASESGQDQLTTMGDLDRYAGAHRFTGARTFDRGELAQVRAVRPRLRDLWMVDEDGAVGEVNSMLREFQALPQLVRHDGWGWHVHAIRADAPLADRICVEAALAVLDLIRAEELARLRRCAGQDCSAVLVDLSRNRSKRYCDVGNCGNRAHVAAYRARRNTAT